MSPMPARGEPPSEPLSIVGFLEGKGEAVPRIRLRDLSGEGTSPAEGAEGPGRYRIAGEIARGGIGVILKGRDTDLGRDVAMKMLRDEYAGNEDVLRRFVEEAQIGGQLQHPNIVPVYEMGLGADRRLYFTMKLIKGQTLAALLEARAEPQSLLLIFEKACQAIAYAHARGVLHRDLKPSNVMVGAFGEVQVVDWGLAKVLDRKQGGPGGRETVIRTVRSGREDSASTTGEILGTPAYMAPEQARGEMESLDERADVFALGAILCEVLTGQPPYVAGDIVWKAAHARLEEAFVRLDRARAEPNLVDLAKRCLAAERAARPKDAGEVADAVSKHLVSVEERGRKAALDAAAARATAVEAQKERKLVIALAAAVLLAAGLGGGGYLWREAERRARAQQVAREVGRSLDESNRLRGEARALSAGGFEAWAKALPAAQRAVALARSGDADDATRARAEDFLKEVEAEETAVRAAAEAAAKDKRLLGRVAELRAGVVEDWDWARTDAAYAEAFRDYGIDVDALEPDAAASLIRATPVAGRLAIALEDWAQARKRRAGGGETAAERLFALAKASDPDPWRARLRDASDIETLRELESSADIAALPAETLDALAAGFGRADDIEHAVLLYRLAQRLHPRDVWILLRLAHWLRELPSPPLDEEARCYAAAVALRPRSHTSWADLAAALDDRGDLDGAVAAGREALRLKGDYAAARSTLGNTLRRRGDLADAVAECREAIRLDPNLGAAHLNLGLALHAQGDLGGAITAYRDGLRVAPASAEIQNGLGNALFDKGSIEGALAAYCEAIRLNPRLAMAHANMARISETGGDLSAAVAACREAIRVEPGFAGAHNSLGRVLLRSGDVGGALAAHGEAVFLEPQSAGYRLGRGNALERKGDLDCAIAEYRAAIRLDPGFALAHTNLGIALRGKGDHEEAVAAQREAVRLDPQSPIAHNNLGMALKGRGDIDAAVAAFRQAILLKPDYGRACNNLGMLLFWKRDRTGMVALFRDLTGVLPASADAQTNLGLALTEAGSFGEAVAALRKARELTDRNAEGREASDRRLRECERLLEIEGRLPALLSGDAKPANAAEGAAIAHVCHLKAMPKAAFEFYVSAFAEDPALATDSEAGRRYEAACAAALAARGAGDDSGVLLRRAAREWLSADLAQWDPSEARDFLQRARCDPDLAAIRDEAMIPVPEREECRALWAEVDALLARAK